MLGVHIVAYPIALAKLASIAVFVAEKVVRGPNLPFTEEVKQ